MSSIAQVSVHSPLPSHDTRIRLRYASVHTLPIKCTQFSLTLSGTFLVFMAPSALGGLFYMGASFPKVLTSSSSFQVKQVPSSVSCHLLQPYCS